MNSFRHVCYNFVFPPSFSFSLRLTSDVNVLSHFLSFCRFPLRLFRSSSQSICTHLFAHTFSLSLSLPLTHFHSSFPLEKSRGSNRAPLTWNSTLSTLPSLTTTLSKSFSYFLSCFLFLSLTFSLSRFLPFSHLLPSAHVILFTTSRFIHSGIRIPIHRISSLLSLSLLHSLSFRKIFFFHPFPFTARFFPLNLTSSPIIFRIYSLSLSLTLSLSLMEFTHSFTYFHS